MAFHRKCNDCSVRQGHNSQFLHDLLSPRWHDTCFDCVCVCVFIRQWRWVFREAHVPPCLEKFLCQPLQGRLACPEWMVAWVTVCKSWWKHHSTVSCRCSHEEKMMWGRKMESFLCRPVEKWHKKMRESLDSYRGNEFIPSFLILMWVHVIPPVALLCGSPLS